MQCRCDTLMAAWEGLLGLSCDATRLYWGMGTFCLDATSGSWLFCCSFSAIAAATLAVGERSAGLRNCREGVTDGVTSSSKLTSMSPCRANV